MKITVEIKKSDMILFNLSILPRLKSTYIGLLIISLFTFIAIYLEHGIPYSASDWGFTLLASAIGGVLGIVFGFIISITYVILTSSSKNGTLGKHEYTLSEEGLYEKTIANESLNKWAGISDINVVGNYLCFKISSYLYHILPKHSFESEMQFNEFVSLSKNYWKNAAN